MKEADFKESIKIIPMGGGGKKLPKIKPGESFRVTDGASDLDVPLWKLI